MSREETSRIDKLLVGLTASSNKTRLGIMIALYDSMVTEGVGTSSMSFTEIGEIFGLSKPELSYHLNVLKKANFIKRELLLRPNEKQYTAYELTEEAVEFLGKLGITEEAIREYRKQAEE